jgi:two-component system, response regulator
MLSKTTVLLVEDNDDDIQLTLRAFKKHHVANELHVVTDGQQAVDFLFARGPYAARDPSDLPHVVLLDLKLPKLDGLEVLRQIRDNPRTRFLPVVVLTSSNEERDLVESYRLGANSYVRKPVDFEQFSTAAQQLGLYWMVLNIAPKNRGVTDT